MLHCIGNDECTSSDMATTKWHTDWLMI